MRVNKYLSDTVVPLDVSVAGPLVAVHDWTEAYFKDLPTGLKDLLPDYSRLEKAASESIHRRLELAEYHNKQYQARVKVVDYLALLIEMRHCNHPGYSVACNEGWEAEVSQAYAAVATELPAIFKAKPEILWAELMTTRPSWPGLIRDFDAQLPLL